MNGLVASAAALGSALAYGGAGVIQHRVARQAPRGSGLPVGLITHLLSRPTWLLGLLIEVPAFALHALALSTGQLSLVQPLLVSGLLFALPASVVLEQRRPDLGEWTWALVLVVGLAAFLVAGSPSTGHAPSDTDRLSLLSLGGVLVGAGIVLSARALPAHRAALLGAAGGLGFGITAALMKETVSLATGPHPIRVLASWPIYLLVAVGLPTIVITQIAYQAGPLAASLPPLTIVNPIASVAIGIIAFHEHLAGTPSAMATEVMSAVVMAAAVAQLAKRSHEPPPPRLWPADSPSRSWPPETR